MNTISETDFHFPGLTGTYRGKVRDVYTINNELLVMVVTDRVSAFDVVLPRAIPYKGQVLNRLASYFMDATREIVPNWVLSVPDPNVTVGRLCKPYKVEMVIRGYLTGHAWREYRQGKRTLCGVAMPDGMKEHDRFPEPIITPTTKAEAGHDLDLTRAEIVQQGLVPEEEYRQLEKYTRELFRRGTAMAEARGLLLVDTKYEFGKDKDGAIRLIDEIHTPDSSRYFYKKGYEERQGNGEPQQQLSKEFLREWLMERGFRGEPGQAVPEMDDAVVNAVSERYIGLYETITGQKFEKPDNTDLPGRIRKNVNAYLQETLVNG
jgi:phosphoribosylaminoimidazole-succinocarboxamide synthase